MKKALTIFLSLFCVFFLGGLRLNDWDFDGYTFIFFFFSLVGSIIITSIIIVKMENNRIIFSSKDSGSTGSDYVRTECKTETLEKKEIQLSIENYDREWFDYDVFQRDKYSMSFSFHSDNFMNTKIPADFTASKSSSENWMSGGKENWFYVELDHRGVGHGHDAPINETLDEYFYYTKDRGVKGIYDCTYEITNYKSLKNLLKEISDLSLNPEIGENLYFDMETLPDFISKTVSMKGIPKSLKEYFKTHLKEDIETLETKEESKKGNVCTSYISMLTIKNGNEKIMSFKKAWDGGINLCFH
ncbi:MAG: hypothetical protein Q4B64_03110 [Spirochaetales bacterium]|nr:hypothetical protein [Spirochaetales bacterium]